jgi:CheY-like chemotaxis protein
MAKTILLVEDYEDDAILLQMALASAGALNPVVIVKDGEEAVAYLAGEGAYSDRKKFPLPSLVLLDLKMPKMDGFQVMEWVKSQPQFKDIGIFVLSGLEEIKQVEKAYALGARSFLAKPCFPDDVRNLMTGYPEYWDHSVPPPQ